MAQRIGEVVKSRYSKLAGITPKDEIVYRYVYDDLIKPDGSRSRKKK